MLTNLEVDNVFVDKKSDRLKRRQKSVVVDPSQQERETTNYLIANGEVEKFKSNQVTVLNVTSLVPWKTSYLLK